MRLARFSSKLKFQDCGKRSDYRIGNIPLQEAVPLLYDLSRGILNAVENIVVNVVHCVGLNQWLEHLLDYLHVI